jgi:hypothetical protein
MIAELKQKKYLEHREFKIFEKEVTVKIRKNYEQTEWTIPFEELGFKKVYQSNPKTLNYIVVSVVTVFLLVMTSVFFFQKNSIDSATYYVNLFLWGLIAIIFSFVGKKNELFLTGGQTSLAFLRDRPSEKQVDQFIEKLIESAKKHLKKKYTRIDKDLSEEIQLNNFYWLRNIEIITDEEYEALKKELRIQKLV